jgi:small-conductance mechanosensitive channel
MNNSVLSISNFTNFLANKLEEHSFSILFSLIVIIAAIITNKISKKALTNAFVKMNKLDSPSFKIVKRSIKYCIIITTIFLILAKFNIPVTALFAFASSALIAIGLALKDFICNIAKSLQIAIMRPFSIGDLIEVDSKKGKVTKIDYMHTYITNKEHGLVMVPNALIADKSIINYSRRENDQTDSNTSENSKNNETQNKTN